MRELANTIFPCARFLVAVMPRPQLVASMRLALFCTLASSLFAVGYPSSPQEPTVQDTTKSTPTRSTQATKSSKTSMVSVRVKIHLGDKSTLIAETTLPESYSFTHKKGQLQYTQTIQAYEIRELAIEGYRAHAVSKDKDGTLFEFEPATVRIELKDGQVFKLNYLFKDLRRLKAHNGDGNFSVYAFFADTWRPRTGWSERTQAVEKVQNGVTPLTRTAHPAAFTRLEYFEKIEASPAGN